MQYGFCGFFMKGMSLSMFVSILYAPLVSVLPLPCCWACSGSASVSSQAQVTVYSNNFNSGSTAWGSRLLTGQ